jgi:hypothetical protein
MKLVRSMDPSLCHSRIVQPGSHHHSLPRRLLQVSGVQPAVGIGLYTGVFAIPRKLTRHHLHNPRDLRLVGHGLPKGRVLLTLYPQLQRRAASKIPPQGLSVVMRKISPSRR